MAGPSSRMLRLLSPLQTHRYWPDAELATRLAVSARTLRRDGDAGPAAPPGRVHPARGSRSRGWSSHTASPVSIGS